ncbi:hypothetical protein D3C83_80590 [compost metagenome]
MNIHFLRDARGEQAGGKTPGLENDAPPLAEKPMTEQHLRNLRGFSGTRGRLEDEPPVCFQPGDQLRLDFVDGKFHSREHGIFAADYADYGDSETKNP